MPESRPPAPERLFDRRDLAALGGLAAVIAVLFWEALLGRRILFQRDILGYWYPQVASFVRCVGQGAWPFWNPWISFGAPIWSDPMYQVLYPFTWLNLLLLPAASFLVFVVSHLLFGGAGVYALCRRLGLDRSSAFGGCAVWCSSGTLLSSVSLYHHFAGAAWMPWVLLALDRALCAPSLGRALALGALGGGQLLAGSADLAVMTGLACALWTIGLVRWSGATWPRRIQAVVMIAIVSTGFAALLAAGQWWPTLNYALRGARFRMGPEAMLYWSVHPASLIDAVVPFLTSGSPVSRTVRAALFGSREPLLRSLYLGAAASVVALLGLARGRRGPFLGAGFAVFVLLALGRHTPVLPELMGLPPFAWLRFPAKYMIPATLFWALLTAYGLSAMRDGLGSKLVSWVAVAAALLLAGTGTWVWAHPARLAHLLEKGVAVGPEARATAARLCLAAALVIGGALLMRWGRGAGTGARWARAGLLTLVVADLAMAGRRANPLAPPALGTHGPAVLRELARFPAEPRIYVWGGASLDELRSQMRAGLGREPTEVEWALGYLDRLKPPTGARWGISGSYDGDFTGLAPMPYSVLSSAAHRLQGSPGFLRLMRLGAVTHVVALGHPAQEGLRLVGRSASVFADPVELLEVTHSLPRVYLARRGLSVTGDAAYAALLSPGFRIDSDVLVEGPAMGGTDRPGTARVVDARADQMVVAVDRGSPGYLVVVEAYAPGWSASIDGAPARVRRANVLFQAVAVPAGRHRVVLWYRPVGLVPGLICSALAALAGLAFWARSRRGLKHRAVWP